MSAVADAVLTVQAPAAYDTRECWELLAALHALRAHVWLGEVGQPSLGLSVILSVDTAQGHFLVDALRGDEALQAGTNLYFDTQVEGRRLRFECLLSNRLALDDGPAYLLSAPRIVLDQQRRSAYRVRVPATLRMPAAINEHGRMLPARLLDLSVQGCSARVESAISLSSGDSVRMHLKLSDLNLACTATVRHVERVPGAARLGMEFELDQPADAAALDQAVAKLQREILRRRAA